MSAAETTYPVQLDGLDPLLSVFGVLCSQVPHAVVHTDVQPALVKLVGLKLENERSASRSVRVLHGVSAFYSTRFLVECRSQRCFGNNASTQTSSGQDSSGNYCPLKTHGRDMVFSAPAAIGMKEFLKIFRFSAGTLYRLVERRSSNCLLSG